GGSATRFREHQRMRESTVCQRKRSQGMKRFALWCAPVVLLIALTPLVAQRPRGPDGVAVQRDLDYVGDGHARHKLDLYVPEKSDRPLPLVIWLHRGAWRDGSKESAEALPLTRKGFAVASINYP